MRAADPAELRWAVAGCALDLALAGDGLVSLRWSGRLRNARFGHSAIGTADKVPSGRTEPIQGSGHRPWGSPAGAGGRGSNGWRAGSLLRAGGSMPARQPVRPVGA